MKPFQTQGEEPKGPFIDRSFKGLYNTEVRRLSRHRTGLMESNETWKPIETAPKDREIYVCGLVRIWADSDPFAWQGEASWDEESEGWITGGYDDSGEFLFVEATHWMESRVVEYPEVPPYVSDDPELNPSERMTPFTNTYNWGRLS